MRKVAIIGSTSFLAQRLISNLSIDSFEVKLWNRNPANNEHHFDYPDNLPDPEFLATFDSILYLAGSGVQSGEQPSHEILYGVNALMPILLINQLRDLDFLGNFITFGSYFELGQQEEGFLASEWDIINSTAPAFNEYSKSKRLLSQFINQQIETVSFNLMHFILPNMFGRGENENRLVPYLVTSILNRRLIKLSNGNQIRQFLDVDDICNFLVSTLAENNSESGIFNLGSPHIISVKELVNKVVSKAEEKGYQTPGIRFGQAKRQDSLASYLALDYTKAEARLNWNPGTKIDDSILSYF